MPDTPSSVIPYVLAALPGGAMLSLAYKAYTNYQSSGSIWSSTPTNANATDTNGSPFGQGTGGIVGSDGGFVDMPDFSSGGSNYFSSGASGTDMYGNVKGPGGAFGDGGDIGGGYIGHAALNQDSAQNSGDGLMPHAASAQAALRASQPGTIGTINSSNMLSQLSQSAANIFASLNNTMGVKIGTPTSYIAPTVASPANNMNTNPYMMQNMFSMGSGSEYATSN